MKKHIISHILTFLLGLLAAGFYYWAFVNPILSSRLQAICNQAKLGYVGDWVLDIFFPIIPLTIIVGFALRIVLIREKE